MNSDKNNNRFDFINSTLVKSMIFSGGVLIVLAFIILRYEGFFAVCDAVGDVFRPIAIGILLAFLLNRPFLALERGLLKLTAKCNKKKQPSERLSYVLALVLTYLSAAFLLAGLVGILIPRISESADLFVDNLGGYLTNLETYIERLRATKLFSGLETMDIDIEEKIKGIADYLPDMLLKTYDMTAGLIGAVIDFAVGVVFSIYILADKRRLKKQAQSLSRIVLKKRYPRFAEIMNLAVTTFSDFASGQCMEAVFIGIFCFIGMQIFGFDYAVLISVIIGMTNMIPIVGPFIGTIPCAFMLLLVDPKQALWFVVFIVVLQQLESNLLYPRVVGKSVGLPPLWVLAAVMIGGGLGGVLGMVIGVPLCSIIYVLVERRIQEEERTSA
ncbi:MAG: AI-2E family transporter [Ruminococcus sp.]|nr:AI-2E family transporter [Ruminococcus sp.]